MLSEVEIATNDRIAAINVLVKFPQGSKEFGRWAKAKKEIKTQIRDTKKRAIAQEEEAQRNQKRLEQAQKTKQRDANLDKPPTKKLIFRESAPKVKKREVAKKVLDEQDQDFMDYDLGDILEFVKGKPE